MSFTFVNHVKVIGNASSGAIDTTGIGAHGVLIAFVHYYPPGGLGATPISDSLSQAWITGSNFQNPNTGNFRGIKSFYLIDPATNASHTFRTNTSAYGSLTVMAFSSTSVPSLDGTIVGAGQDSGASINTGSITPATANDLFVSGATCSTTGDWSNIPAGYSISDSDGSGSAVCSFASVYKIKSGDSSAENLSWSLAQPLQAVTLLAFQEAGGPPPPPTAARFNNAGHRPWPFVPGVSR